MSRTSYQISEIAQIIGAEASIYIDEPIQDLLTDSRTYVGGDGFLFFALISGKNDGHKYIEELYIRGVRSFVVSDTIDGNKFPNANILRVEDPLKALQVLAATHRQRFSYPVVGITGSNGKTIVKEWLFQLLQPDFSIVRSPRSYNSQVGVPLSIWLMTKENDLAILECGISKNGEMSHLAKMVKPSIGIFTNIGPAHQENFQDFREKTSEKLKLFSSTEILISCRNHTLLQEVIAAEYSGKNLTWGEDSKCDLVILDTIKESNQSVIRGNYNGNEMEVTIPFSDDASIENACHCWLYLLQEGIDKAKIAHRLSNLSPIAMRLEKRTGINRCTIINDSYNSDLASLDIALDFLAMQAQGRGKTLILSDILQTGKDPASLYTEVSDIINRKGIEHIFAIGEEIGANSSIFGDLNIRLFEDTEAFLNSFSEKDFEEMAILVKGARAFRFERIVHRLEQKTHETVMEIDLNKMNQNLDYIRSLLNPSVQIMAMVKAFAYGSGSSEVAAALEYAGVDYLAVAYADEGIALRESGIKTPIMVLNPVSSAYDSMIRYELEPQIYSFLTLDKFTKALSVHSEKMPYRIHLKVNTGMNRLGFDLNEIDRLSCELLSLKSEVKVYSAFSHLAGSDDEKFDQSTKRQIDRFDEACKRLEQKGITGFIRHILNSNGILRHKNAQMDMVRLGLGLYGLSSNEKFRQKLQPISRLKTVLSQIRIVPKGEGIGYSPEKVLDSEKRIGVIAMGYADGLPRAIGNGTGQVFINDKFAPLIGNICMDMAMIDLSEIECDEGDEVEIFGENNSIYTLAENLNTIPYEVLTNISTRVKRVFYKE
ncbi:bifunctional UDP-N-acetylmuramoyl-tripeptide:D-alanyl-D-alanine ligase/alanine racemase [Cryomorphaceae bacterium 1068]|nr:bifunctional UDP-N-acetylmuramoyl-tripeptide:D-alanyl-D-alanine ligase/alanine racemase [Cryomorphaceae bacterium 1068]